MLGVEILWSEIAPEQCFQAAERDPSAFKRWVYRPIVGLEGAGYRPSHWAMRTAGAFLALQSAVSNLREPVAPTPPSGGLSHFSAVLTRSS